MHDVTFSAVQSREGTYWHGEAFPPPSVKFGFGLVGNWGVYTQRVDQSSASTVVFGKISVFGNLKPYNEKKNKKQQTNSNKNPTTTNQRSLNLFFVRAPAE